jgi:hypothetical protein
VTHLHRRTEPVDLAVLLLLVVTITHWGYDPLCALVPGWEKSAWAVFYVLRGVEGAVLFGVVWYLKPVLWPICLLGFTEESETAVCRLAAGISRPVTGSAWTGLCGAETGLPLYMAGLVYVAVLVTRRYT